MKPRISVVVPAFNEEKRILSCISSLQKQTLSKEQYEIIIVDNNSSDKTAKIAKKTGVRVVFCLEKGVAAARQYGVDQSVGEVVVFTDADSFVSEDWLSQINKNMQNKTLLLLGGKVMPDTQNRFDIMAYELADLAIRTQQLFGKVLPWGINMAVRKDVLKKIGGFDPNMASAEDWDVSLRVQKEFGKKAAYYDSSIIVFTSNRKQQNRKIFAKYVWDGVVNYTNFVLLGRKKLRTMITIR